MTNGDKVMELRKQNRQNSENGTSGDRVMKLSKQNQPEHTEQ
jgi:hypothetical protein